MEKACGILVMVAISCMMTTLCLSIIGVAYSLPPEGKLFDTMIIFFITGLASVLFAILLFMYNAMMNRD